MVGMKWLQVPRDAILTLEMLVELYIDDISGYTSIIPARNVTISDDTRKNIVSKNT